MASIGWMRGFGIGVLLAAVASLGPVATTDAQEREFPGWERIPTRDRLLAVRAARVVGMRDLGGTILALRIDGRPLSEHLGAGASEKGLAGRLIRGFQADDPRYTDDGFARVRVWIRTDLAWAAVLDLGLRLPEGLNGESFARAVGTGIIEVEGKGRAPGFASVPRPAPARPDRVPSDRDDEEQGSLPDRDRRHASRESTPRSLDEFDRPRERAVTDQGWRIVSTRVVRTWEVPSESPHPDCDSEGRWETIETRVIERKIVSERIVVR